MNRTIRGKVYLIGAGPGDPELITVKGRDLLNGCDAVVYDSLVPAELIVTLPDSTELYYVGKKPGRHSLSQDDINRLLVELAGRGMNVARLKGGDPFVFGRGAEEARFLRENDIKFEIIPGITAGVAAPASAYIPCTDRKRASYVIMATGHKAIEKELSSVPWEWVAKAKKGTIVIYMGVGELERIIGKLLDCGMSGDTPSAVIERGTLPTQRVITSPLESLFVKAEKENIQPPAIIIIGDVVDLRSYLQWSDGSPLLGVRVMVTRPADQAHEIYERLRKLGAEVLPYPTIATTGFVDEKAWGSFGEISGDGRWLVFTSENGVRYFISQFRDRFSDIRGIGRYKIAAIGGGTASYLRRIGFEPDFIPSEATTRTLARELKDLPGISDSVCVRVRGNLGDDKVERAMAETGATVITMVVYHTSYRKWPDGFKEKLFEHPPHVIIFTSGSTADGLFANLDEKEVKDLVSGAVVASIGPTTTGVLEEKGLQVKSEAKVHTIEGLLDSVVEHYRAGKGG
jgi:uroporphyrinogen III methyltransferase/synthase